MIARKIVAAILFWLFAAATANAGITLTIDMMQREWPRAPAALIAGMVQTSAAVFAKYGITTPQEAADFMAQGSEETGAGTAIVEDLYYSAARMMVVWPRRFPTLASAAPYAQNPRALADIVYGGLYGNRPGTDDGYTYRGRGFIQLTFRTWYQKLGVSTGLDLVDHPELVNDPQHFLEVGAAFWKSDAINYFSDKGDFSGETLRYGLRLNGGLTNYPARLQWRIVWRKEFGLPPN